MELHTERLLLRSWRLDDAEALVRHVNHREVWRNTGALPFPYSRSDAEAFFKYLAEHPQEIHLAIVPEAEPVGSVGIYLRKGLEQFVGELGYWLGPSVWGKGYATEAARALSDHVFATTDLQRIEGRVFAWNPASRRVLEKAGFQLEGVKRRAAFKDGEHVDEWLFSRLRGE
ncbi:MAG TPA: GNAT family N-acetyltransferase [Myxococcota bacterium]|nr:GNAT family N-acetyltransferase [Myxococcota bacterium]